MAETDRPRLALVLGSGSARGLAHIGVLEVLEREGFMVDLIVGTSIGALIGGVYACGVSPGEMGEVARSIDMRRLVSLADVARPSTALINGRRVERFIRGLIGSQTFADTQVPLACVAVDVYGEREVVLQEGDLPKAIRASLSTPILFAPVEHDGRLLVDGAVLDPVPVNIARDMGARTVVAVTNFGIPRDAQRVFCNEAAVSAAACPAAPKGRLPNRVYSGAVTYVLEKCKSPPVYQLAANSVDLMQRELSEPRLREADLVIAPLVDATTYYGFHEADRMIAAGRTATEAALDELHRLTSAAALVSAEAGRDDLCRQT